MLRLRSFAIRKFGLSRYFSLTSSKDPAKHQSTINSFNEKTDSETEVSLPTSADVVIIGGGAIGCSTLYHLALGGLTNAVLLEQDLLSAGTTWHTAGLLWNLRPSDLDTQLIRRTRDILLTLEENTGVFPGWINNGGLFIAGRKERLDEYKRLMTLGKAFGIESQVLSANETLSVHPLLKVKDVYGSLYSPDDGTIDPSMYVASLSRGAVNLGAKVIEKCSVKNILTKQDSCGVRRIEEVHTTKGSIKTRCVVNCAGIWAPRIGEMVGVRVPLLALKHAYVQSEHIDGIENTPNVRDHDASIYLKLQGDSVCLGGYENNPLFIDKVENNFAFSLYELDWNVFQSNIDGCVNRLPALETCGIKSTICGPESFTADHKPVMGEAPELRGFYLNCGYNSAGMMLSGGCGEQMARWIINGVPDLDMFSFDIRRFSPSERNDAVWLKERSHESYVKNYSIVFPNDEPLAGRNHKRDSLHEELLSRGCVYQEKQGWERPGWFTNKPVPVLCYDYYGAYENQPHDNYKYKKVLELDYSFAFPENHTIIGEECKNCRKNAALFNMSYFGKFVLVGKDSQKAADLLFTADMRKHIGSTVYTCMLNKKGGVEADLTVSRIASAADGFPQSDKLKDGGLYLTIGGGQSYYAYSHINNVINDNNLQCELADFSDQMSMLSIQGPASRQILQQLTETKLDDENFPFSTNSVAEVAGCKCFMIRVSFVGELGWEIHTKNQNILKVYRAIMESGSNYQLINSGYRALDSLSLEKGYRHWHGDLRSDDTPHESGLSFTCKLDTDIPFIGRETVERQAANGINKRLCYFTLTDKVPLKGLEAIVRDGIPVGFLRRADYAFTLGCSVGVGYVRLNDAPIENKLLTSGCYEIEHLGTRYKATCHLKSPFDPKHKRLKGIYT